MCGAVRMVQISYSGAWMQCSFVEQRNYKVIYRRYASLFFIVGVDGDEVCRPRFPLQTVTSVNGCSGYIRVPLPTL